MTFVTFPPSQQNVQYWRDESFVYGAYHGYGCVFNRTDAKALRQQLPVTPIENYRAYPNALAGRVKYLLPLLYRLDQEHQPQKRAALRADTKARDFWKGIVDGVIAWKSKELTDLVNWVRQHGDESLRNELDLIGCQANQLATEATWHTLATPLMYLAGPKNWSELIGEIKLRQAQIERLSATGSSRQKRTSDYELGRWHAYLTFAKIELYHCVKGLF